MTLDPSPVCLEYVPPWWHLSVGVCVAIAGCLGVIVPLARKDIGPREKAIWIAVVSLLTILELRMIIWSDQDNEKKREYAECLQLKSFSDIETTSQTQFAQTMNGVGAVLLKAQEAADRAEDASLNATGADSYLYLYPAHIVEPFPNDPGKVAFATAILGKHPVYDADVAIIRGAIVDAHFYNMPSTFRRLLPVTKAHTTGVGYVTHADANGTEYAIRVDSRGTVSAENLTIRLNKQSGWEYSFDLYRQVGFKTPRPSDLLKHQDWTPVQIVGATDPLPAAHVH